MKRNVRPKLKKQVDNTKKDTIVLKHEEDKPCGPLRMIINQICILMAKDGIV